VCPVPLHLIYCPLQVIANYPLFYHSDTWNVRDFIMMNISSGLNTPDGGRFSTPTATVTFLSTRCRAQPQGGGGTVLPPGPGDLNPIGSGDLLPLTNCSTHLTAKFTTDGSSPSNVSASVSTSTSGGSGSVLHYSGPITIKETTTIRALISVDGVERTLIHSMTFIKEENEEES
jgi:hypothetical protein